MRKNILFLVAVALSAMTIITSCGKTEDCSVAEEGSAGTYYGAHILASAGLKITDTLTVSEGTAGDGKITVTSNQLGGATFDATVNTATCRYEIEPITIPSLAIGDVSLNDIEADGFATKNGNTIKTTINIKKGTAVVADLNIPIAGQKLTGSFSTK